MAAVLALSTTARNAMADAIVTDAGSSAILRIYTATRPASGASIGGATLLAEITLGSTIGTTSGGVLTISGPFSDTSANNTGTAAWGRLWRSNGTTWVADFNVGTSSADLILNTVSIVSTGTVTLTGGSITIGNA